MYTKTGDAELQGVALIMAKPAIAKINPETKQTPSKK